MKILSKSCANQTAVWHQFSIPPIFINVYWQKGKYFRTWMPITLSLSHCIGQSQCMYICLSPVCMSMIFCRFCLSMNRSTMCSFIVAEWRISSSIHYTILTQTNVWNKTLSGPMFNWLIDYLNYGNRLTQIWNTVQWFVYSKITWKCRLRTICLGITLLTPLKIH